MIELHVKTRDVTNIRAHAQKFLLKLVKLLNTFDLEIQISDHFNIVYVSNVALFFHIFFRHQKVNSFYSAAILNY